MDPIFKVYTLILLLKPLPRVSPFKAYIPF
jgi:hypothetical protein